MDLLRTRCKSTGPTDKMHYEVGFYDASWAWHILVVSGPIFETYKQAQEAADRACAAIIAACKRHDARARLKTSFPVLSQQGGAA